MFGEKKNDFLPNNSKLLKNCHSISNVANSLFAAPGGNIDSSSSAENSSVGALPPE